MALPAGKHRSLWWPDMRQRSTFFRSRYVLSSLVLPTLSGLVSVLP